MLIRHIAWQYREVNKKLSFSYIELRLPVIITKHELPSVWVAFNGSYPRATGQRNLSLSIFLTRMLEFFFMRARFSLLRFTPNILGNKTETALKRHFSDQERRAKFQNVLQNNNWVYDRPGRLPSYRMKYRKIRKKQGTNSPIRSFRKKYIPEVWPLRYSVSGKALKL